MTMAIDVVISLNAGGVAEWLSTEPELHERSRSP